MISFGKTEKRILFLFGGLLLIFSYLLFDDTLFQKKTSVQQNSIGDISFSENDVRRKSNGAFSWLPANKADLVYHQDSIYTGSESSAEVQLTDGTLIEIKPNSLVTLNIQDGQMNLNLSYGNFVGQIAKGSALKVHAGDEELQLTGDNSKVQINKNGTGKIEANLLDGNASVSSKSGKTVKLNKAPVEAPSIELVTPAGNTFSRTQLHGPIPLQWRSRGSMSKYEVVVADDAQFTNPISQEMTKNQRLQMTKELAEGKYFWRINAYNEKGTVVATSETRDFQVELILAPKVTSPTAQSVLNLELPGKPEDFTTTTKVIWQSSKSYSQYRVQIAKDPQFREILKDVLTTSLESQTPSLASGTYYTRVAGVLTDKKVSSPWSNVVNFRFELTALKEVAPPAPILLTQKIIFKAPPRSDRAPAAIQNPLIAWRPVNNVPTYKLQIAKDKEFTQPSDYNVASTKAKWSQYRPGKYYYRVYSLSPSGMSSEPSSTGEMNIQVDNPVLAAIPKIHLRGVDTPPPQAVQISWSEVPFAKSYLVEYDTNKKFVSPQRARFSSNQGTIQLPTSGKYHLRVKAVDEENQPISQFSNNELANYIYDNPLMTPAPSEPFDKASIFLQTEKAPYVWLEWKSVEGAQNYLVEVSNTPDFAKIIVSNSVSENRFLIKNKIPLGKLFWRVRALSVESQSESEWSPLREFSIFQKPNEIFVK